jgi:hypothetical protein
MRRVLPIVVVLAVGALALQGTAAPVPTRPAPKNLRELGVRLDAVAVRIQQIVEAASRDPDAARIKQYASYGPEQMKKTRGRVRAEDLVEWMLDSKKNFITVRQAAAQAILARARQRSDPELSTSEKQGSRTRLAHFCEKHLVKHLAHDSRMTRGLVHALLDALLENPWGSTGFPEIQRYGVDAEKTWRPAIKKWRLFLKKH